MPDRWLLKDYFDTYAIFRWRPLTPDEIALEYKPTASDLGGWLEALQSRQAILEMYEFVCGRPAKGLVSFDQRQEIISKVEDGFRRKVLICLRMPRPASAGGGGENKEGPKPTPPSPRPFTKSKTWIAIELVDDKGKPIPKERYRIELPDGSKVEDKLDANGYARIDNIDPGECQISFPDIDGREWKPA
jgi:hypothetical protein